MQIIEKIKEHNIALNTQELETIENLVQTIKNMPKPTTKTEAQLFLNKIKELKIYTSAIEEFIQEQVKKANANHKLGVAKLKEFKKAIEDATNVDKVLEYANEELSKNPLFKLTGTTKKSSWIEYVYDEEEIIKVIITDEEMLPFVKLDKKAFEKWLSNNPTQTTYPIKNKIRHQERIT